MLVLAYLDAVANEFICNQWERNGMSTMFIAVVSQYGTRGKCPTFCCWYFFVMFLNCRFRLMSIFNSESSIYSLSEQ